MTVWEMLRVLVRRWPVVVVGVLLTVAIATGPARGDSVVFSRTELAFLAPTSSLYPNALRTTSDSVIITAGVVARRVGGPGMLPKFASTEVTLFGQGIHDGWSLRLPDTGGQWAPNFAQQSLILEVVGPSTQVVRLRLNTLITQVNRELTELQKRFGVDQRNLISAIEVPQKSTIYEVGGDRRRTLGMVLLLGGALTAGAALTLDRAMARVRLRRVRTGAPC